MLLEVLFAQFGTQAETTPAQAAKTAPPLPALPSVSAAHMHGYHGCLHVGQSPGSCRQSRSALIVACVAGWWPGLTDILRGRLPGLPPRFASSERFAPPLAARRAIRKRTGGSKLVSGTRRECDYYGWTTGADRRALPCPDLCCAAAAEL